MGNNKLKPHDTELDNLISNLRGEIGFYLFANNFLEALQPTLREIQWLMFRGRWIDTICVTRVVNIAFFIRRGGDENRRGIGDGGVNKWVSFRQIFVILKIFLPRARKMVSAIRKPG
jgi:hypothetical protein